MMEVACMSRRYVLKNKKRFYLFVIILSIIFSSVAFAANVKGEDTLTDKYISVVVKKGDTLWDIARKYNQSGDVRKYIRKVERINNLTDSLIYEGDVLKLPV